MKLKIDRGWPATWRERALRQRCMSTGSGAFTMIEIAISLAVIGFALVAIIGILPTGMNVQKENREDTIINQDFSIFIDAIRNGARGLDDLTNYVMAITNYKSRCRPDGSVLESQTHGHTYTDATSVDGQKLLLTNGFRIVGLLSIPRFVPDPDQPPRPPQRPVGGYFSNYVVAFVRSISGSASEKFPQTNQTVQDLSLSYRLVSEIVPFDAVRLNGTAPGMYDPDWTNYTIYSAPEDWVWRSNYWKIARVMQTNQYDVRLIFRWPLLQGGTAGNRRQVFRTTVTGHLLRTNDYFGVPSVPLYFFDSRTLVKAQL